jgi:hypothetical protein
MPDQLELDLGETPVYSLREYRRGWQAARALWMAGFDPSHMLPPCQPGDEDMRSFALGWRNFIKDKDRWKQYASP